MMRTGLYLGCDPGKRSGLAWLMVGDESVTLMKHFDVPEGVDGFTAWWDYNRVVFDSLPVLCVFEGFTTREGKFGIDHTPERVIGALKALASRDGVDLIERAPAGRKRQVPDEVLKRMGLYQPGERNRNSREAIRHTIAYLKSQKHPVVLEAFG